MKKLNIKKMDIVSIQLFLILCLTQFSFKIPNELSVNNWATIDATMILFAIVFLFLVYKILIKKEYKKEIKEKAFLVILTGALIIYYILSVGIRFLVDNELVISINMTYSIIIGVLTYLIIYLYKIKYESIIKGITYFFITTNIYLVFSTILNKDIRTLEIFGNINVYISFVLIVLPLTINYFRKLKLKYIYKFMLITFIIISTLITLLLSGSRYALICIIVELVIYYIFFTEKYKKQIIEIFIIGFIFVIMSLIFYNMNDVYRDRINRTFEYPIKIYNLLFEKEQIIGDAETNKIQYIRNNNLNIVEKNTNQMSNNINITARKNENENNELKENDKNSVKSTNAENTNKQKVESLTRETLFEESIKVISENFWLGTGRQAIYIDGWGYQAAHNYILEAMLCYGMIGACIYFTLVAYPIIKISKYFKQSNIVKIFLYSYIAILVYSMVEPILSNKIIILICVWGIASAIENNLKKEKYIE